MATNLKPKDLYGREISIGDYLIQPHSSNHTPYLTACRVLAILGPAREKSHWNADFQHRLRVASSEGSRLSVINLPSRCLLFAEFMIGPEWLANIKRLAGDVK